MAYIIAHITGQSFKDVLAMYERDERMGIHWNVSPGQENEVVAPDDKGDLAVMKMKWGHFAQFDAAKPPTFLINARSETALQKRTFAKAMNERRCLVPCDGFYEWKRRNGKSEQAYYFTKKDQGAYFMAGLRWDMTVEQPAHYIVLTTAPNELLSPIHDRMPVILDEEAARQWMDKSLTGEQVLALCRTYPASEMNSWPVSNIVNSAANDVPECVVPVLRMPEETQETLF